MNEIDAGRIVELELPARSRPDWLARCIRSEGGKPLANVANVLLALRDDAGLQDALPTTRCSGGPC